MMRRTRMVYEFDAADVPGSHMYPSMAKFFRSEGVQVASQFQYDALPLAAPASAPASLVARGITSLTDNLPPGAGLDIAKDFARVFRAEIECRLFGWQSATPARRSTVTATTQPPR